MIKNTQKTFMLLTMAVISMAISVPTVFAEEVTVSLPPGTSVPGCEETNECYIPLSVTVHPKHTFDTLGEYPYFCMVHPWMEGSVIVTVGGGMEKDLGTITLGSAVQSPSSTMISSSSSMKVSNTDLMIGYEITTGKVVSVMPDVDSNSLVVGINTNNPGTITLELPRSVIDAKMSDNDDEFFVVFSQL